MSIRFSTTIYQRGASARIDVPDEVTKAFGDTGYVSVRGTMNGAGIRGTLIPVPGGPQVLNVNLEMRTRASVDVGDMVVFTLDRGEATTPAKRKAVLTRLAKARTPETIAREVEREMHRLRTGKV